MIPDWGTRSRQPLIQPVEVLDGILVFLLVLQRRIRIKLREIGDAVFKARSDAFMDTIEAGFLTLGISMLWPGLMWLVGWRLLAHS